MARPKSQGVNPNGSKRLHELLDERGLSQRKLAKMAGLSVTQMNLYATGKANITRYAAEAIAGALGGEISPEWIMGEEGAYKNSAARLGAQLSDIQRQSGLAEEILTAALKLGGYRLEPAGDVETGTVEGTVAAIKAGFVLTGNGGRWALSIDEYGALRASVASFAVHAVKVGTSSLGGIE